MKSEIILEHDSLTLTYYPEASCILETWKGFTSFELFSSLLEEVLKLMVQKGAKNLILDTRMHRGLSPQGQEHGVNRCTQHAKQHGQMLHAIIVPEDVFSKFSVENFVKKLDKSQLVVNAYFREVEDALNWITTKHE
ncbi:MAG: hypothetical protein JXA72_00810 [Bacteroidales bacterium]|nr:hypothetical protein [Bacteroidales bacterium]